MSASLTAAAVWKFRRQELDGEARSARRPAFASPRETADSGVRRSALDRPQRSFKRMQPRQACGVALAERLLAQGD